MKSFLSYEESFNIVKSLNIKTDELDNRNTGQSGKKYWRLWCD